MSLRSHFDELNIPPLNAIFKCEVVNLQDYGAFLKIPGYRKNGLLHKQQISKNVVDNVSEVLAKGDEVWCKVISVGSPDDPKISLSMKVVEQGSGKDLDPNGVEITQDERKRKENYRQGSRKITLEAVLDTVCKRCGTKGHLSQDCYSQPGSKSYDLVADESSDDDNPPPPKQIKVDSKKEEKITKKKNKKHKKEKKKKKHKSHDKVKKRNR